MPQKHTEFFNGSQWYGDKHDGIEVRIVNAKVDEIILYRNGECVVHLEALSDQQISLSMISKGYEVHTNLFSVNDESKVSMNVEGWER